MSEATTTTAPGMATGRGAGTAPVDDLSRLPAELVDSLTPEQRVLLARAMPGQQWKQHPVDMRFTLPLFSHGLFVTLVAGVERRGDRRRRSDRARHPLHRVGNVLFLAGLALSLYGLVLLGAFLARDLGLG